MSGQDPPPRLQRGLRRHQMLAWIKCLNEGFGATRRPTQSATTANIAAYMADEKLMFDRFGPPRIDKHEHEIELYNDLLGYVSQCVTRYKKQGLMSELGKVRKSTSNHYDLRQGYRKESRLITEYSLSVKGESTYRRYRNEIKAKKDYAEKHGLDVVYDSVTIPWVENNAWGMKEERVPRIDAHGRPIDGDTARPPLRRDSS